MLGYCLRSYESVSAALFCREKLHAYDLRCRLVCPCAVHAAEKGLPDCGYTDPWAAEICVFFLPLPCSCRRYSPESPTNAAVYCIPIFCLFSSILSASLQQAGSMKKSGMLLQTHMSSALSLYPSSYIFSILPEICLRCPVRSIFTPPKTRFLKLQSPQLYCC